MPVTRPRISTSREPSAWPTASSETGTAFVTAFTVATCRGGASAAGWALPSALPQPARTASAAARTRCRAMPSTGESERIMGREDNGGNNALLYIRSGTYVKGHMRRTKEEAALTRAAIVEAGLACFDRHGINGTTLDDIAAEAGVTKGAIYHHF